MATNLKQYQKNGTYFGYDPLSGSAKAYSSQDTLKGDFANGIDPNAPELPFDPSIIGATDTLVNHAPVDNSAVAGAAARAGLGVDDYLAILKGNNPVSDAEKKSVYDSLGLTDLEKGYYAPDKTTEQLFSDAYAQAGLADIKNQYKTLMDEVAAKKKKLVEIQGNINENPWLSEASRIGRTSRDTQLLNNEIQTSIDQANQLQGLYTNGLTEVNNLVSRVSTDQTNKRALTKEQITELSKKAEDQIAALQSSKLSRYLPEYLAETAGRKAPDTIGNADTGFFQWNPDTKKFEPIAGTNNTSDPIAALLKTEKQRTAFNQIVNNYNKSPLIAASDRTIILKNTIDAIKADPGNAAQQMNLAYSYIQALDTYQSAVREGEIANVNSIDSVIGKFQNTVQQLTSGQTVRPEIALELAAAAGNLVSFISQGAAQKEKVFESQANVNGISAAWNAFRAGFQTNYQTTISSVDGLNVQMSDGTIATFPTIQALEGFLRESGAAVDSTSPLGPTPPNGLKGDGSVSAAPTSTVIPASSTLASKNPKPGAVIAGFDIGSYATDPNHEKNIRTIYQRIPPMTYQNPVSIDVYIQQKAKGSPVKGQDVIDAAKTYNVDANLILALMQQDSSFGTKGKAVRTKNPGNVGNTDSGGTQGFASWREGVFAVARNLSKRRVVQAA